MTKTVYSPVMIKEAHVPNNFTLRHVVIFAAAALIVAAASICGAAAGTLSTLYLFTGGADGGSPIGGVVADGVGTLYGETSIGGAPGCVAVGRPMNGCGTLYSFNGAAGLKVLVSFTGSNGAYGQTTPTLSGTTLYGATNAGGTGGAGVIFSVHTDGSNFTLLHQFSGADGQYPAGNLRLGPGNILYGITSAGGAHNYGILFSLKPNGAFSILHDFAGGADGRKPETLLISPSGTLVGSTAQGGLSIKGCTGGCGTIFEYALSSGRYSLPFLFPGNGSYGGYLGALGAGPTVYGNDGYAPFSLSAASGLVNIGCFSCNDLSGNIGSGPLLAPGGNLIGINGASGFSGGVLYSASAGALTALAFFGSNGTNPLAQPILMPSGQIIGTATQAGLCSGCGTIWEYTP